MKTSESLFDASISHHLNARNSKKYSKTQTVLDQIVARISHFSRRLAGSSEPRIWHKTNALGQTTWFVFDPETSASQAFSSEQAVRMWLETRYSL
jgi:hypothetical protein